MVLEATVQLCNYKPDGTMKPGKCYCLGFVYFRFRVLLHAIILLSYYFHHHPKASREVVVRTIIWVIQDGVNQPEIWSDFLAFMVSSSSLQLPIHEKLSYYVLSYQKQHNYCPHVSISSFFFDKKYMYVKKKW